MATSDYQRIPVRKVALGVPQKSTLGRQMLQGIIAYARRHPYWEFAMAGSTPYWPWEKLRRWQGDGMIVAMYDSGQAASVLKKGIPVVNTSSATLTPTLPTVHFDNERIGEIAARHLIEKGRERFVFFGTAGAAFALQRLEGFQRELARKGFKCTTCMVDGGIVDSGAGFLRIVAAVQRLEVPVGIMAATDGIGLSVLQACHHVNLKLPAEVAVISCDNDESLCALAPLTMTSIDPAAYRVGYEAAAVLDLLMKGQALPERLKLIPPNRVESRDSTDVQTVQDPCVADALRYIRGHSHEFIDVTDVLRVIPISRRSLERRFTEATGRGVYEEIQRAHVERAKHLLEQSDLPIVEVAFRSGYHSMNRFEVNFRRLTGCSALQYRRDCAARKSPRRIAKP